MYNKNLFLGLNNEIVVKSLRYTYARGKHTKITRHKKWYVKGSAELFKMNLCKR